MKIAITGENGFLGYHLRQYFLWKTKNEIVLLGRDFIESLHKLKNCDLLIHCAGVNRGQDIFKKNIELSENLVSELNDLNIKIPIKFISSTQETLDNEYGKSKIKSKEILEKYCISNKTKFSSYKVPNLFGPFGKPNYNSFINTFCHSIANNIDINIKDNFVDLCYVYDAINVIDDKTDNFIVHRVSVSEIYKILLYFNSRYSKGIIPKIENIFQKNLFNTFRLFLNNKFKLFNNNDERGSLFELLKCDGSENQIFYSTTKPGVVRGNHFHFGKIERFCVLQGKAEIKIRKIGSDIIKKYIISGTDPEVIDMPVLHSHSIKNIGDEILHCVFWVDEIFDEKHTDTYFNKV